jgi:hypothetical protein
MNAEIRTEAAQFLFWKNINPNFFAVCERNLSCETDFNFVDLQLEGLEECPGVEPALAVTPVTTGRQAI